MNPRVTALVVGVIITVMGLASLFYPDRVMGLLGFTYSSASNHAVVLGEMRATYGGIFVVMGIFTTLAALDPFANRGRLLFVGLLWLGAAGGRLFGVFVDGNPGLLGWLALVFEMLIGGALCIASQTPPKTHVQPMQEDPFYVAPPPVTSERAPSYPPAPPVPPV
jgi:hypothetical protein